MDVKSPAAADSISRPSSTLSAPAEPSRVTVALRRAGIAVAGVGVAALTAAACVLSFEDLRDLAIIGEARPNLAYLYPAAFDALLVIAMIGVLLLRGGRWLVRLQAGVILVLLFAAAATAEVTTAMRTTAAMDVRQAAVVVAVAPWVILVVALWLWLLLIKHAAARRSAVDEASADHERDIVPFPDADLPTAEHPAQPEWRTRPSRPDLQVHPDPLQHDRPVRRDQPVYPAQHDEPVHPTQHDEPVRRDQPVHSARHDEPVPPVHRDEPDRPLRHDQPVQRDQHDLPVQRDRQAPSVRPGQLVHHPAAEIMLDPQAAPPLESAPHHDLPASVPVVGPTPAPETPEVTEFPPDLPTPQVPPPAKPMRWGDLVRPRQGDMLVHPPRTAPEAVQEQAASEAGRKQTAQDAVRKREEKREEESGSDSRVSERVRTWDSGTDAPEEAAQVDDRDADTQPIRTMPDQTTDRAAGETADEDEPADGSSPDPAHGVEAADPEDDFGIGSREKDTVAPPSGRMRSTPIPPVE
ncbi:Protein of unknown function [Streptosporangium subroseum]|uniref:DUF2637 domain-containing protein n=1 Tax=Streptosporangium subroseum TaxID=106412 RepID=A0A239N6I3_9ACTN|nr:DUF2637 domain-containing protein [Streptosporangium subroseum]SNT50617.1 Protein of unknown function [Streptosporangium subroseum]